MRVLTIYLIRPVLPSSGRMNIERFLRCVCVIMAHMNVNRLSFAKYSGNGNDFIILDHPVIPITAELVERLCHRHFGVGADGVLILTSIPGFDGEMRIFNADGGEASMCGNGLRCLVTYMDDVAVEKIKSYLLKTMNHEYRVVKKGDDFAVEMSEVKEKNSKDLSSFISFKDKYYINTGVPHLVFLVKEVKSIDIRQTALEYRYHPFFPQG